MGALARTYDEDLVTMSSKEATAIDAIVKLKAEASSDAERTELDNALRALVQFSVLSQRRKAAPDAS